MIKETIALLLGFAALAFSGKFIYRGFRKITGRFFREGRTASGWDPAALMLTGFSLATLFVLLMVGYTAFFIALPLTIGSLALAGVMILLFDNLIIFIGYRIAQRMNRQNLSRQLMLQKQQTETSYYRALEEQYSRQRVLIHDMRKHLRSIRDLAGAADDLAVVQYVTELERSPALQNRVRICGNRLLDVILARYAEVCKEKDIRFSTDIRDKAVDFLGQSDMTALFGNLVENAVEAAGGAPDAYIELICDLRAGDVLMVSLVNSCAAPPKADGMGGFASTKEDPDGHGLGLKSIAEVVGKYDGTLRQYYDEGTALFHTVILIKQ